MNTRLASPRSSTSVIEILEKRVAPAGLVTATFANGVLTLTGDNADNDIAINFLGESAYQIVGANGTTIALNGAPGFGTVSLDGDIASIKAQMGLGNDAVTLNIVATSGAVSLDGEAGNDTLTVADSQINGALTVLGGGDNDNFFANGALLRVGGALFADLGDGANNLSISAAGTFIGGPATILGGSAIDIVALSSSGLMFAKGLTANLGGGENLFTITAQHATFGGALKITHGDHPGTAQTTINSGGQFIVNGPLTIDYGTGNSTTNVFATNLVHIGGAFKVTSLGANDNVLLGSVGQVTVKGGVTMNLGDGSNLFATSGGALLLPFVTVNGGIGNDTAVLGSESVRVGAVTFNLGAGGNFVSLSGVELRATGLVKVTTGAGDDTFVASYADARLSKGVLFAAGDGVNSFSAEGGAWQTGSVNVQYGDHAADFSSVAFSSTTFSAAGKITVTTKAGNDLVSFSNNVLNARAVIVSVGDGSQNNVNLGAQSTRLGAFNVTGGIGAEVVFVSGEEVLLGGIKAFLGGGVNSFVTTGNTLVVAGKLSVNAGDGNDAVSLSHTNQRFGGGIDLALGDGVSNVAVIAPSLSVGGGIKLVAGDHAGTSTFTLSTTSTTVAGPLSLKYASGDSIISIAAGASGRLPSVQVQTGAGDDLLQFLGGTSDFTIGAVKFNAGDGNNTFLLNNSSANTGAVQYTGGDGTDTFSINAQLGRVGAVTANFGSGAFTAQFQGTGQSRILGAVKLQAANLVGESGTILVKDLTFNGAFDVKTGDGEESITVFDSIFAKAVTVNTQGGADNVNIESIAGAIPTTFRAAVNLSLGAGADLLNIGDDAADGRAIFLAAAKFDGGADADTAHVSFANFSNVYLPGQPQVTGFETED